jgi:hypothetical protein
MKQLIELINFRTKNEEGDWRHFSSYHKDYSDGEKINVLYHEDVEGCIETALVTPSEYWIKLKDTPVILKDQKPFVLRLLKEVIGDNSDLVHLDTNYILSLDSICYYLLYNFEYIEATLHIETLTVTVQKKGCFGIRTNYEMPKVDYLRLVSLLLEEFKKEDIEDNNIHSSEEVVTVQDYKEILYVG